MLIWTPKEIAKAQEIKARMGITGDHIKSLWVAVEIMQDEIEVLQAKVEELCTQKAQKSTRSTKKAEPASTTSTGSQATQG